MGPRAGLDEYGEEKSVFRTGVRTPGRTDRSESLYGCTVSPPLTLNLRKKDKVPARTSPTSFTGRENV